MTHHAGHAPDPQPNVFGDKSAVDFSLGFWLLLIVTGIGAGLGGAALMGVLRLTQHLAWTYRSGDFLDAVQKTSPHHRVEILVAAGLLVVFTRFLVKRPTGGHGGELSAAIWFRSGQLPFFRTLASAVLSMIIVGLGAALGREGAPKQIGALLGGVLAKWRGVSSAQRRLLTACGAGAGLAAVYNVPLGGALFTMEILLGTISLSLAIPALVASCLAVGVSWLFLPNVPVYSLPNCPFSVISLAAALTLGLVAGILSAFYLKWIAWADSLKPQGKWRIIIPLLVFTALGFAAIVYPQLLGNGKNVVQLAFLDRLGTPLILALLFLRPLATGACIGSGAPGGLFTPTLTFGALLGAAFGHAWNAFLPGEPIVAYAFIGAGAVFAAGMKAPFSALVLLFELTGQVTLLVVPLLLAVAVATAVATRIDPRSIYSARIHLGKAAARDRRKSLPPGVIFDEHHIVSAAMPYAEVAKRWIHLAHRNRPLAVVDEDGNLIVEIGLDRLSRAETFAAPLETASADDLATPTKALDSSLTPAEMESQLVAAQVQELPVTETKTNRLLGFYRAK